MALSKSIFTLQLIKICKFVALPFQPFQQLQQRCTLIKSEMKRIAVKLDWESNCPASDIIIIGAVMLLEAVMSRDKNSTNDLLLLIFVAFPGNYIGLHVASSSSLLVVLLEQQPFQFS